MKKRILRSRRGGSLLDWTLLAGLIGGVAVVGVGQLGDKATDILCGASNVIGSGNCGGNGGNGGGDGDGTQDPPPNTPPTIDTGSLPEATVGQSYAGTLDGTDADGDPLTWSVDAGSSLPEGMTLSPDGTISGTPTTPGTTTVTVVADDGNGGTTTRDITIVVNGPASARIAGYGTSGTEQANRVVSLPNGDFYATSGSVLYHFNANAELQWSKSYNGCTFNDLSIYDYRMSEPYNEVLFAACSWDVGGTQGINSRHMMLDLDGTVRYAREVRTNGLDRFDIAVNPGHYPNNKATNVGTGKRSYSATTNDIVVVRTNGFGYMYTKPQWFGTGTTNLYPRGGSNTSDFGVIIAGDSGLVVKFIPSGNDVALSWARTVTIPGWFAMNFRNIVQTSDGGYAAVGSGYNEGTATFEGVIVKLTSSGSVSWARRLDSTNVGSNLLNGVTVIDGDILVSGLIRGHGRGDADMIVARVTNSGSLVWANAVGGTALDVAVEATVLPSGEIAVVGYGQSATVGGNDALIGVIPGDGSTGDEVAITQITPVLSAVSATASGLGLSSGYMVSGSYNQFIDTEVPVTVTDVTHTMTPMP